MRILSKQEVFDIEGYEAASDDDDLGNFVEATVQELAVLGVPQFVALRKAGYEHNVVLGWLNESHTPPSMWMDVHISGTELDDERVETIACSAGTVLRSDGESYCGRPGFRVFSIE